MSFEYDLHVFHSPQFQSVVDDAIRFFSLTPTCPLPPEIRFAGAGVYALYYKGDYALYTAVSQANSQDCVQPIYVGKTVAGFRSSTIAS